MIVTNALRVRSRVLLANNIEAFDIDTILATGRSY